MDHQVSALGAVFSVKGSKINHSRTIANQFNLSRQQKTPAHGVRGCFLYFFLTLKGLEW
jgi:hypothetical protein